MRSLNLIVLGIAVLAALAFVLTTQQQNAAAFNDRNTFNNNSGNNVRCDTSGTCHAVSHGVYNDEDFHSNGNCNTHRDSTLPCKSNAVIKP